MLSSDFIDLEVKGHQSWTTEKSPPKCNNSPHKINKPSANVGFRLRR